MKRKVIVVFALFFSAVSCQKNEGGNLKKLSSKDIEIDFADLLSETPEFNYSYILTLLQWSRFNCRGFQQQNPSVFG